LQALIRTYTISSFTKSGDYHTLLLPVSVWVVVYDTRFMYRSIEHRILPGNVGNRGHGRERLLLFIYIQQRVGVEIQDTALEDEDPLVIQNEMQNHCIQV